VLRSLQLFMNICLFQARPQDLTASRFLFFASLVAALITGLPILWLSLGTPRLAVVADLMDMALMLLFLRGGLYFLQLEPRFLQTATALLGTGAIMNLVTIPVHQVLTGAEKGGGQAMVGGALFLVLLGWQLAVTGHILRYALSIRLAGGIAIAVVYFLLITLLVQQLLPVS
jgi:hypothetical protein